MTPKMENQIELRGPTALGTMAARLGCDPIKLHETLTQTVFKGANQHELMALVLVANQYGLNPITKQIYAFPAKGGGIAPVVSVDGWASIVNRQEDYDGCEFGYEEDDTSKPISCTCTIHLKSRSHPVQVTEFMAECARATEPWRQMPRRMLRHKAFIQAARLAFGLGGIQDEDEARDPIAVHVDAAPVPTIANAAEVQKMLEQPAPEPDAPRKRQRRYRASEPEAGDSGVNRLEPEAAEEPADSTPAAAPAAPAAPKSLDDLAKLLQECAMEADIGGEVYDQTWNAIVLAHGWKGDIGRKRAANEPEKLAVYGDAAAAGKLEWGTGKIID